MERSQGGTQADDDAGTEEGRAHAVYAVEQGVRFHTTRRCL
jgi:hypothetical protein